LELDRLEVILM